MREIVLRGRGPNTMTLASLRAFGEALEESPETPILLYGEGDAFSAGLDLRALADVDPRELTAVLERMLRLLFLHPAPVVAAVNGHAVAGGCLVAQACDLRIGKRDPSIKIGMTGVAIGIHYPPSVMRVLQHRLPKRFIEQVILGAERHSPERALALGLLDELADDPIATGRERLARLAQHPRAAYAAAKLALRAPAMREDPEERRRYEEAASGVWDRGGSGFPGTD